MDPGFGSGPLFAPQHLTGLCVHVIFKVKILHVDACMGTATLPDCLLKCTEHEFISCTKYKYNSCKNL
jgi:hypothetical protein